MYQDMMDTIGFIEGTDPALGAAMQQELQRQRCNLELIASENIVSPAVMAAMGSILTNKYAEGYPGKRYYGGCQFVDVVEDIARQRACQLFGAEHANVQPHSGAQANIAVYFALLQPGDTVMGMNLSEGGHLTHGSPVNLSGKYFNFVSYGVDAQTGRIDYDKLYEQAMQVKPKMIVSGASAYPRAIDFARIREVCDACGALMMVDMAHIAGWFYRDAACFYPEVWAGRPLLDRIKQYPIRFGTREEQRWLEKRVALFFVPTQSFAVDRGLSPFLPLPPGSDALRTGFFSTEPRGKRCIYVGGLSHRYGTDLMLRAFARLNRQGEYPLTVVCRPGETEALRPFRGNSWLTVCHEQGRGLAALYEKQDLALYPLRSGAYQQLVFSVKIPEYLANGLPVAAVYSRETAAFLQKWGVGRCCEDREEAFAGLVHDMLENRREYRNMTERIALCVKNNQWKDRARQAADALQPACGKREST